MYECVTQFICSVIEPVSNEHKIVASYTTNTLHMLNRNDCDFGMRHTRTNKQTNMTRVCIKERIKTGERNDDDDNDRNVQNNSQEKIIQVIEKSSEQMENLRHSLIF